MSLSDLAVRRAKTTGKAYTIPDTLGLSLAVTATGDKRAAVKLAGEHTFEVV
ncbi:hypothetical protein [Thauera sinica]|uniref:hypothetical protein n=1 Tax=Thauera sp. K11 TaxID=2005884 RepID=UPI002697A649